MLGKTLGLLEQSPEFSGWLARWTQVPTGFLASSFEVAGL